MNIYGEYFFGNKISAYGLEHGFVDYGTLVKAFDAVLNNDIFSVGWGLGEWEQVSGYVDNSELIEELENDIKEMESDAEQLMEEAREMHDSGDVSGADDLENKANDIFEEIRKKKQEIQEAEEEQEPKEVFQWFIVSDSGADILQQCGEIVYYHEYLGMYVWGVTHWGTSWDYVLTNIPCNTGKF